MKVFEVKLKGHSRQLGSWEHEVKMPAENEEDIKDIIYDWMVKYGYAKYGHWEIAAIREIEPEKLA